MPYSKEHKQNSRARVVASAAKLFPRIGFDEVSIDMVMADAGLTRGAFYAHFANKAELYAEAMQFAAQQSPFRTFGHLECSNSEWFELTIAKYLSREHIDESHSPCPLAFLITDINRRDETVRSTYTRLYTNLVKLVERRVAADGVGSEAVMAAMAMMVGGAALANALNDKRAGDKLLQACRIKTREILAPE